MPAKTPAQRKLFGAALAAKRGAEPISKKVADIASKTSEKELSKMASKPKKKVKKEGMEGTLDAVYAVQKPYVGCQLTSLVKPIDPLVGLEGSEIVPEKIHAVYADQEMAQNVAQQIYEEYQSQQKALEEKKIQVIEKIKKTMDGLEKQRKESVEMIKENPKDASAHKEKVAKIAAKMDHLVNQLQRIEMSKKEVEKEEKNQKEEVKENLSKYFKSIIKENAQSLNSAEKEVVDLILGDQLKEGSVNPNTIMQRIRTLGAKGLLTLGIISTVLTSCGPSLEDWQKQEIKDQIEVKAKELEQKEKQADWDQEMAKLKSSFEKQGSKLDSLQSMKN